MSRALSFLAALALVGCATPGADRNAAPVDPCDCGDEQQWDRPPPAPAQYTPKTEDDPAKGQEPEREAAN